MGNENSYLVLIPNLLKVDYDNQVSVYIAEMSEPVEIKFDLMVNRTHTGDKITCKLGETHNAVLNIPHGFPIGVGKLTITGTGGLRFEEQHDVVIYDNRHVILVQTSASTYHPTDTMKIYVVIVASDNLIPMESGQLTIEIYDATRKLVGKFPRVPVQFGLSETIHFAIAEHVNIGAWLVSATVENTTSSVEILVSHPVTSSFDPYAIFPPFLDGKDNMLDMSINMGDNKSEPIVGHALVAIGQITEQEVKSNTMILEEIKTEWRKWKSEKKEIAGRVELNYDLLSSFEIDVTRARAILIYIRVTNTASSQVRRIRQIIPVFSHDIMHHIRPLGFHAGMKNKCMVIAKRPDGQPIQMENMIVTVRMTMGDEQGQSNDNKTIEIKAFDKRGRDDIGFFNVDIPENCIDVRMTFTPLSKDGEMRGYHTHAIPLMPRPRRRNASGAKLTIELSSSTVAVVNTDVNAPAISSQISTVGRESNFYVQLISTTPVEKIERLLMLYILMTNGRITLTGEFFIELKKESQPKTNSEIRPEKQRPPTCVFQGTLPISMTSDMVPYSTLLVYTFQPPFGFCVAEPYRFSVDGLFKSSLKLNATIVQFIPSETDMENRRFMEEWNMKSVRLSEKVQDKTRVKLSFTGTPDSILGVNIVECHSLLLGVSNDMSKERVLERLTSYEQDQKRHSEQMDYEVRYPVEKMFFGVNSRQSLPQAEGDDIYTTSNMGRLYDEEMRHSSSSHYHNSNLRNISQEAFTFMRSGLIIISDFKSLHIPIDMKRENLAKLFARFHEQSMSFVEGKSFGVRDEARLLLEEYIARSDLSMMPPSIMVEEQSRIGYHRSLLFHTTCIESTGTVEVVLPPTKPFTTWIATGFALNAKSGLSMAQPVRLPTIQGLYVLGSCPRQVRIGENVLSTLGVNNYLGKDLSNVVLRIRASNDFDLMEETKPERMISMKDKHYTYTIPSLKSFGVETRNFIWVPKRSGMMQIIIEVESEFGGDYEVLTVHVGESDIRREELSARLFDLTSDKKTYEPIVEKINDSPAPREVQLLVSGTDLDRFVNKYTMETNSLVGIDRAIVCLYRSFGLRRYLKETLQTESPLFKMTRDNITCAYQNLQFFCDYDGSYSMFSDKGTRCSSLYLTSLAFGAMISPEMPFHDNVTLNRTLTWILSHQQEDGSFDDKGRCFHYRLCATDFRRESLTAIVLYSLTLTKLSNGMSECIRDRLFNGVRSPIRRAYHYLELRLQHVKRRPLLIQTLIGMAFIQNPELTSVSRGKIQEALLSHKLTVVPEDGSKYINITDGTVTFDDQLLLNAMALSIYDYYNDRRTVSDIARWIVNQIEIHPHYDTVLVAVFSTQAWLKTDCLFREEFGTEKLAITVDVSSDSGQTHTFTINSTNMDVTQNLRFTLPVGQITYSVSGFGIATVVICEKFIETEQKVTESMPFKLTQEFELMSCMTEIKAKTCMTYTPLPTDLLLAGENFDRTIVMEIRLPSGMSINERQLGFFFKRDVPEVMHFTYSPHNHKLHIFINVLTTGIGKEICLKWYLERLSTVTKLAPMEVRVYDYLQPERQLVRLFPIKT